LNQAVLTIAGSDPSGGAGIQADLRTLTALGVDGLSVITAITAQSSLGVFDVYPVAPNQFTSQLNRILDDTKPDAVKIGMLGSAKQVEALIEVLQRRPQQNIVLDPVLASTGGVPLLDPAGRYLLLSSLLSHCSVVTPNIEEACLLTGEAVNDNQSIRRAGEKLLSLGAKAVLIKGGHLQGPPTDWLFQRQGSPIAFSGRRVESLHAHGAGCLLSASIAAFLASGKSLPDAVFAAKSVVCAAFDHPVVIGKGRGFPDAAWMTRTATLYQAHKDKLALLKGLYVVTDRQLQAGRSHVEVAEASIAGGARIIQLRDKSLPDTELIAQAKRMSKLAHSHGVLFIVNDRVDVALAADADGVHLGPEDIAPVDARRLLGESKLVGVSTGTVDEAHAAAPFASYFGVGAIFGSATKTDAGAPITVRTVTAIKSAYPNIPIVAIGGINAGNIQSVVAAGADSAAVVSAVVSASNITDAVRKLAGAFAPGKIASQQLY
jgi:hydroxymethylpyrimidine kinase/phosphomethylpyrimidine kinase/thiamine-phosphate diphosphorylase